jgi:hypothetical protein
MGNKKPCCPATAWCRPIPLLPFSLLYNWNCLITTCKPAAGYRAVNKSWRIGYCTLFSSWSLLKTCVLRAKYKLYRRELEDGPLVITCLDNSEAPCNMFSVALLHVLHSLPQPEPVLCRLVRSRVG